MKGANCAPWGTIKTREAKRVAKDVIHRAQLFWKKRQAVRIARLAMSVIEIQSTTHNTTATTNAWISYALRASSGNPMLRFKLKNQISANWWGKGKISASVVLPGSTILLGKLNQIKVVLLANRDYIKTTLDGICANYAD